MAVSSVLCALTLAFLVLFSKAVQDNHSSKLSKVFPVFVETEFGPAGCHDCIIKAVGITQIRLLESDANYRLYWVDGHQDIEHSFLWHCGTIQFCDAPMRILQTYRPESFRAVGHYQIPDPRFAIESEISIYQWADELAPEKFMTKDTISNSHFEQSTQHRQAFLTKQELDISVFFENDRNLSPPWTRKSDRDRQ
uniref:CHXC16 n=1 Tax=Albugo laibachii Nc14 TaxID=890382 RepID=F0W6R6_9STRA|nr:CHXC16 [Albugo laibachii Nc14]|eukprot:CCA16811.1 CHXC16 [Albugo laibachii Nc14]